MVNEREESVNANSYVYNSIVINYNKTTHTFFLHVLDHRHVRPGTFINCPGVIQNNSLYNVPVRLIGGMKEETYTIIISD